MKDGIEEETRDGETDMDGRDVSIVVARSVDGREDCPAVELLDADREGPIGVVRVGG